MCKHIKAAYVLHKLILNVRLAIYNFIATIGKSLLHAIFEVYL